MENEKFNTNNETTRYLIPTFEIIELKFNDIITTSPRTETPWYEENDGIWDISIGE